MGVRDNREQTKDKMLQKEYFDRQIKLWGEDIQNSLGSKKIAIVGCGGLGSSIAIALGASGIGYIHLIDFDEISLHNIHRQIAFKSADEGKPKAKVLSKLLELRCPYVKTVPHICTFEEFTKKDISLDLIIDATDNLPVRLQIDSFAKEKKIPWIYGSVEEFNAQVCFFEKSGFKAFKIIDKTPGGIAAAMVMQTASFQANLALRFLAGLSVRKDLLYYIYFNDEGEMVTQKFKMPIN
jgi:molybdopterin/thiamine biosynthesis adenylyltransferase